VIRGPLAETLWLTGRLVRFRLLATQRDWSSHRLYLVGISIGVVVALVICAGTFIGVRALASAKADALLVSIAAWAFLTYLVTDIFIAFGQALNDLYLSSDMPILIAMPLRVPSLVVAKFVAGVLQNEVYVSVFLLPFVVGYLAGTAAPWWSYPLSITGLALFPAVLYAPLAVVTIVALRVIPPRVAKEMLWVVGVAIPTAFWLMNFARVAHLQGDVTLLRLPATAQWLPSTWMGDLLAYASTGDLSRASSAFGLTTLIALLACPLAVAISSVGFGEGWSRSVSSKADVVVFSRTPPSRNPVAALVWKDLNCAARSPQLWFSHIAALGFIGYLLIGHQVQQPLLPLTVQLAMLQIGFVAVLDALNPGMTALSLEHRSIWLLRSIPLTARQISAAKMISAYLQTAVISCLAATLLGAGYGFSASNILALAAFALIISACTVCFGVAFDTRFPSFDWENPNSINRGVRMIIPFVNGVMVLTGCAVILWSSRVALPESAAGVAVALGIAGSGLLAALVAVRTTREAVSNIQRLEL